jgi:hypothetical protein
MHNYNNFIFEKISWVNEREITKDIFSKMKDKYCSDFSFADYPIYRSVDLTGDYYIIKPSNERRSAYVNENYYTMLINNEWTKLGFPKRTFICTNEYFKYDNQDNPNVYRVIPFNGAKIGVCPFDDIQVPFDIFFNSNYYIDSVMCLNVIFKKIGSLKNFDKNYYYSDYKLLNQFLSYNEETKKIKKTWQHLKLFYQLPDQNFTLFKENLKKNNESFQRLNDLFLNINKDDIIKYYNQDEAAYNELEQTINKYLYFSDYDNIIKLFNPFDLGFELYDYKEYANTILNPHDTDDSYHSKLETFHEIWLDSNILLINEKLL